MPNRPEELSSGTVEGPVGAVAFNEAGLALALSSDISSYEGASECSRLAELTEGPRCQASGPIESASMTWQAAIDRLGQKGRRLPYRTEVLGKVVGFCLLDQSVGLGFPHVIWADRRRSR